jgi:hypothetical protein
MWQNVFTIYCLDVLFKIDQLKIFISIATPFKAWLAIYFSVLALAQQISE